jgi:acetyltransferase-like isoleucine patch superfamily enzyme
MNLLSLFRRARYSVRGILYRGVILLAGGQCGRGFRVEPGFLLRHGAHKGIRIGDNVYLGAGTVIDCPAPGIVSIGSNATLTHGVFISAARRVVIGNDALIGEYVSIRDADHQIEDTAVPIRDQPMIALGCEIGNDVWIGRGSAVLAGAKLNHGCVIGANSVVKGEIPAKMIAVGAPARAIRPRRAGTDAGNDK